MGFESDLQAGTVILQSHLAKLYRNICISESVDGIRFQKNYFWLRKSGKIESQIYQGDNEERQATEPSHSGLGR